jgi:hypothetical protein
MDRDQNLKPVTKTLDNVYAGMGLMDLMETELADVIGSEKTYICIFHVIDIQVLHLVFLS